MEEKVLFNVLRQISKGEACTAAPDKAYINALVTIGMVKDDWDRTLTTFGRSTLERLRDSLEKW